MAFLSYVAKGMVAPMSELGSFSAAKVTLAINASMDRGIRGTSPSYCAAWWREKMADKAMHVDAMVGLSKTPDRGSLLRVNIAIAFFPWRHTSQELRALLEQLLRKLSASLMEHAAAKAWP